MELKKTHKAYKVDRCNNKGGNMNLLLALVLSLALSIFAWGQDVTPEVEEIKLSRGDIKDYFKEFGVNEGNYGTNALETQGSSYLEALALHLIHQSSIKQKHEILSNDPRLYNPLMIGDTQIYFVGVD